jgi:hypothetical protein
MGRKANPEERCDEGTEGQQRRRNGSERNNAVALLERRPTSGSAHPRPPRLRRAAYNPLEAQYDDRKNRWALGIMTRFARY